jgi:hypothetical protein
MKPDELKRLLAKPKRNKYGAVKEEYNGRVYHSKKEANFARNLDLKIKAGIIKFWHPQKELKLIVNGALICKYIIDFYVCYTDNSDAWIEVKGKETPDWRIKFKLAMALYPGYTFIVEK